jgi:8-amino-7-oxononanoate synthase
VAREKVLALALRFRRGLAEFTEESQESHPGTAIVPVLLGDAQRALAVSGALESQGFLLMAIRPPTVPSGTARLRVTFSAAHEEKQVDALLAAVRSQLAA